MKDKKKLQRISSQKQGTSVPDEAEDCVQQSQESNTKNAVRTLAAFYLGYLVYQLVKEISVGNVSNQSMPWMLGAIVLFCVGIVWLIWPEVKRIKEALGSDELR